MIQLQEWIKKQHQHTCLCSFKALLTESDQASYAVLMQLLGMGLVQVLCGLYRPSSIYRLCVCCRFVDTPFGNTANSECYLLYLSPAHCERYCRCSLPINGHTRVAQSNSSAAPRSSSCKHTPEHDPNSEIYVPIGKAASHEPVAYASEPLGSYHLSTLLMIVSSRMFITSFIQRQQQVAHLTTQQSSSFNSNMEHPPANQANFSSALDASGGPSQGNFIMNHNSQSQGGLRANTAAGPLGSTMAMSSAPTTGIINYEVLQSMMQRNASNRMSLGQNMGPKTS